MKTPVYFDYMASTPVDPRVAHVMQAYLTIDGIYANPGSAHAMGLQAKAVIEQARAEVAQLIEAEPEEIIWTSGATESNNLAIKGIAEFYQRKGKHIITCASEHKATLQPCQQLKARGFDITFLPVKADGLIDLELLAQAIRPSTILITLMHVNNEIGVIQDIKAIGELARKHGVIFHVDAVQSAGKVPLSVKTLPVDLISFSGHKCYGPKGIGALYIRREPKIHLTPQISGAPHEMGLRAGTLATHQIAGMGMAYRILREAMAQEIPHLMQLRARLWAGIQHFPGIQLNGSWEQRVCNNLNVSFQTVQGEALLMAVRDLAVSSGAACSTHSIEPSHVLRALGHSNSLAHSSIRLSFGRFTTVEEIDYAIHLINTQVLRLHELSTVAPA